MTNELIGIENQKLPEEFAALEPYIQWAGPDEFRRLEFRENQTMDVIQEFYDAMLPQVENILAYFKRIDEKTDSVDDDEALEARTLMNLMYGFSDAALSVELHKSPTVPDGMPWYIWKPEHDSTDWKNKPQIQLFPKVKEPV